MMKRIPIIGVMGPGKTATAKERELAFEVGTLVAQKGWITLSGGVNVGVMDAVSRGAKSENGLTIGIIPRKTTRVSRWVDVPILTDMGAARNNMNALTCFAMVVCGINEGTVTEIGFALQAKKYVILINPQKTTTRFFKTLNRHQIVVVQNPKKAIVALQRMLR